MAATVDCVLFAPLLFLGPLEQSLSLQALAISCGRPLLYNRYIPFAKGVGNPNDCLLHTIMVYIDVVCAYHVPSTALACTKCLEMLKLY